MADPSYRVDPAVMVGKSTVISHTPSTFAGALADNDVAFATEEIANFFRLPGGTAWVHSIVVLDEDDQAQDLELIFMDATGSVGAEDAAYAPTDTVARSIIGTHLIVASEYSDANTSHTATKTNVGLLLKAAAGSTSLFIAGVCRSGTPTYTATGLKLKIGVSYD